MRFYNVVLVVLSVVFFSQGAAAAIGQVLDKQRECLVHEYSPGEIIRVNVAPYANLHIQMHADVFSLRIGGGRMWGGDYSQKVPLPHIWVKSKTDSGYDGQTTSMTVLDVDMNAYNFVLNRRSNPGYTCVVVKAEGQNSMDARLAQWEDPKRKLLMMANEKVRAAQVMADRKIEAIKEHSVEQLKNQRARLYTNYHWDEKASGFFASKTALIKSVMDDGIFTYITLNKTSDGLMSIYGLYGDKEHQVQMQYDPQLKQYTLTGVYNQIRMRYQKSEITIKRKDG